MTAPILLSPEACLTASPDVVLVDVRTNPEMFLPGALHAPIGRDFCNPGAPGLGRNPWKAASEVRKNLARLGLTPDETILFYDEGGMSFAARARYAALCAGYVKAGLLDGGFAAWTAAGGPTTARLEERAPVDVPAMKHPAFPVFTFADALAAFDRDTHRFLDARPRERWLGMTDPVDARPGRIPGAVSLPATALLQNGRLLPVEDLRKIFDETLGDDPRPVLHYCGSGIAASLTIFASELVGRTNVSLYPGSWSEWCVKTPIGESSRYEH